MRKKRILLSIIVLAVVLGVVLYTLFEQTVRNIDFKALAEKKVSALMNAPVSIDKINLGFLSQVDLSGLRVSESITSRFFFFADINKVVFKYSLANLLNKRFWLPSSICLEKPVLEFKQFAFPRSLFTGAVFSKDRDQMILEITDGALRYRIPKFDLSLDFSEIDGFVRSGLGNIFEFDFKGKGTGDINGGIKAAGRFDKKKDQFMVDLFFDRVSVIDKDAVPLKKLTGQLQVEQDRVGFNNFSLLLRDIPVILDGEISDFGPEMKVDICGSIATPKISIDFALKGKAPLIDLEAAVVFFGRQYAVKGKIEITEDGFLLKEAIFKSDYNLSGTFDLKKGLYLLKFEKGKQAVEIDFSHEDYKLDLDLGLKHVDIFDYDVVTIGKVSLEPDIRFWRNGEYIFNGEISTEYMIFNFMPLNDFHSDFVLSPEGIKDIKAHWGEEYYAEGNIKFNDDPQLDMTFQVKELDLSSIDRIGPFPLSDAVDAVISSKIHFLGEADAPRIDGEIRSLNGRVGALDFDKILMHFSGDRHLLGMYDSKIYRSGAIFEMKGNIDFSKRNIFQDLVIESNEKIVLWRGWDLSKNLDRDTFSLKRKVADNVDLNVKSAFRSNDAGVDSQRETALSLEYSYENDQSFSLSFEENDKEEEILSLKHKITF